MTEASDFRFGTQLGLAQAHLKKTNRLPPLNQTMSVTVKCWNTVCLIVLQCSESDDDDNDNHCQVYCVYKPLTVPVNFMQDVVQGHSGTKFGLSVS